MMNVKHNAECLSAECHCTECHHAECHYAECRGANRNTLPTDKKR